MLAAGQLCTAKRSSDVIPFATERRHSLIGVFAVVVGFFWVLVIFNFKVCFMNGENKSFLGRKMTVGASYTFYLILHMIESICARFYNLLYLESFQFRSFKVYSSGSQLS